MRSVLHLILSVVLALLGFYVLWIVIKMTFSLALTVLAVILFLAAILSASLAIRSFSRRGSGGPRTSQ